MYQENTKTKTKDTELLPSLRASLKNTAAVSTAPFSSSSRLSEVASSRLPTPKNLSCDSLSRPSRKHSQQQHVHPYLEPSRLLSPLISPHSELGIQHNMTSSRPDSQDHQDSISTIITSKSTIIDNEITHPSATIDTSASSTLIQAACQGNDSIVDESFSNSPIPCSIGASLNGGFGTASGTDSTRMAQASTPVFRGDSLELRSSLKKEDEMILEVGHYCPRRHFAQHHDVPVLKSTWRRLWAVLTVMEDWTAGFIIYFEAACPNAVRREQFHSRQCQIQCLFRLPTNPLSCTASLNSTATANPGPIAARQPFTVGATRTTPFISNVSKCRHANHPKPDLLEAGAVCFSMQHLNSHSRSPSSCPTLKACSLARTEASVVQGSIGEVVGSSTVQPFSFSCSSSPSSLSRPHELGFGFRTNGPIHIPLAKPSLYSSDPDALPSCLSHTTVQTTPSGHDDGVDGLLGFYLSSACAVDPTLEDSLIRAPADAINSLLLTDPDLGKTYRIRPVQLARPEGKGSAESRRRFFWSHTLGRRAHLSPLIPHAGIPSLAVSDAVPTVELNPAEVTQIAPRDGHVADSSGYEEQDVAVSGMVAVSSQLGLVVRETM
ncbi:unnamed protein product [Protopolystoma xenopodis]|uniref:Uncharacterized protein n=1 Tax=Protopolystoma xenopodis TaxID=117903 RepID=A0A3S5FFM2_9PLAT|nr:unnamed protein product [Protopolystoma xenopodis]